MKNIDPVIAAQCAEFRAALEEALELLTDAEREAFADVVGKAEGTRRIARVKNSTQYVRELRCRKRLRTLLARFED